MHISLATNESLFRCAQNHFAPRTKLTKHDLNVFTKHKASSSVPAARLSNIKPAARLGCCRVNG